MDKEDTSAGDDELLGRVQRIRHATMKDMYVFAMAMAMLHKPGARTRAVNAARRIDAALKEYK